MNQFPWRPTRPWRRGSSHRSPGPSPWLSSRGRANTTRPIYAATRSEARQKIGIIPGAAVVSPAESHSARCAEAIRARTTPRNARGHNAGFRVEPIPIRAVEQPASLHCSRCVKETPAIIARNPTRFHGTARNRSITARVQIVGLRSAFRKADGHDALVVKPIPKAIYIQPSFDQNGFTIIKPSIIRLVVFPAVCWMRCLNRNRRISISP